MQTRHDDAPHTNRKSPVGYGLGHEVVLGDVLGEGDETSGLVQDVLPHEAGHPRHTLDPRHVGRDVGAWVGRAEIHLRRTGKRFKPHRNVFKKL